MQRRPPHRSGSKVIPICELHGFDFSLGWPEPQANLKGTEGHGRSPDIFSGLTLAICVSALFVNAFFICGGLWRAHGFFAKTRPPLTREEIGLPLQSIEFDSDAAVDEQLWRVFFRLEKFAGAKLGEVPHCKGNFRNRSC